MKDPKTGIEETEWQRQKRVEHDLVAFHPAPDRQIAYVVIYFPSPRRKLGKKVKQAFRDDRTARAWAAQQSEVDTVYRDKTPVYRGMMKRKS